MMLHATAPFLHGAMRSRERPEADLPVEQPTKFELVIQSTLPDLLTIKSLILPIFSLFANAAHGAGRLWSKADLRQRPLDVGFTFDFGHPPSPLRYPLCAHYRKCRYCLSWKTCVKKSRTNTRA
jgi:hypothetical protein